MFAVATGTTIPNSLGRLHWPLLSLYFFDVYGPNLVVQSIECGDYLFSLE
jgi:hypothetical protein